MSMITWAGAALPDDVYIEKAPQTDRPARKIDKYEVPGRNGSIIIPQDAWEDVTKSYEVVAIGPYNEAADSLMSWLYAPAGYQRLEDEFDSDVYRMAYVDYDTEIKSVMDVVGRCEISFRCDPRRFLKAGELSAVYNSGDTITNPTAFVARPLIVINGSGAGSLTIGGQTLEISPIVDGMIIDCEAMNAYKGSTNLNGSVSGVFPTIAAGVQAITLTGGVQSVSITPRWWRI